MRHLAVGLATAAVGGPGATMGCGWRGLHLASREGVCVWWTAFQAAWLA